MDDFERLLCLKWIIKNYPQYHILSSTSIHCRYPRHFFKLKFRNSLKKHNMNMQFCFLYWFVNLTSILLKIENVTNSMQILFSHVKCPVYEMFYKNATCCLWNVLSIKCPVYKMSCLWNDYIWNENSSVYYFVIYEMAHLWKVCTHYLCICYLRNLCPCIKFPNTA